MQTDGRETTPLGRAKRRAAALEGSDTLRMEGIRAMPADGDFAARRA